MSRWKKLFFCLACSLLASDSSWADSLPEKPLSIPRSFSEKDGEKEADDQEELSSHAKKDADNDDGDKDDDDKDDDDKDDDDKDDDKDDDDGLDVSTSLTYLSKYVDDGVLEVDGPILQPALEAEWKHFHLLLEANLQLTNRNEDSERDDLAGKFTKAELTADYRFKLCYPSFALGLKNK